MVCKKIKIYTYFKYASKCYVRLERNKGKILRQTGRKVPLILSFGSNPCGLEGKQLLSSTHLCCPSSLLNASDGAAVISLKPRQVDPLHLFLQFSQVSSLPGSQAMRFLSPLTVTALSYRLSQLGIHLSCLCYIKSFLHPHCVKESPRNLYFLFPYYSKFKFFSCSLVML